MRRVLLLPAIALALAVLIAALIPPVPGETQGYGFDEGRYFSPECAAAYGSCGAVVDIPTNDAAYVVCSYWSYAYGYAYALRANGPLELGGTTTNPLIGPRRVDFRCPAQYGATVYHVGLYSASGYRSTILYLLR